MCCDYANLTTICRIAATHKIKCLSQLKRFEVKNENTEICLSGGASVLKRENDTIGKHKIKSLEKLLDVKGIKVGARAIGASKKEMYYSILKKAEFIIQLAIQNKKYSGKQELAIK